MANSVFSRQTKQILIENSLKRFFFFFISLDAKSGLMGTGDVLNSRSLLSLEVCKGPVGEGKGDPIAKHRNIVLGLFEAKMLPPHVDLGN